MLTDQAAGLPILERNAEANADAFKKAQCTIPTVHKLTWYISMRSFSLERRQNDAQS